MKRFWIITAANPLSKEHTKVQNAALNEELQKELNELGLRYAPVICKSADRKQNPFGLINTVLGRGAMLLNGNQTLLIGKVLF